jgi:hypothetical protein
MFETNQLLPSQEVVRLEARLKALHTCSLHQKTQRAFIADVEKHLRRTAVSATIDHCAKQTRQVASVMYN